MQHSWNVTGPLLGCWIALLLVTLILKVKLSMMLLPVLGLVLVGYLCACTLSSWRAHKQDERQQDIEAQTGRTFEISEENRS